MLSGRARGLEFLALFGLLDSFDGGMGLGHWDAGMLGCRNAFVLFWCRLLSFLDMLIYHSSFYSFRLGCCCCCCCSYSYDCYSC